MSPSGTAAPDNDATGNTESATPDGALPEAPRLVSNGFYIEVSPGTVTLAPGATRQFTAVGHTSTASYSVRVDWRASGGSVTAGGLFTAPATAGTYRVIATRTGDVQADTGVVTVRSATTPAPSFWIEMTPSTAAIAPGGTQQFAAVGRSASGASYSMRIIWRATGGSVSAGGLYTAPAAPGVYSVIATRDGDTMSDTATVTVGSGGTGGTGSLAGECSQARAEWIWCDDFEANRLSSYFEYDDANGRFTRQPGIGNNGSYAMRAVYNTVPQTSAGALHLAFGKTPQAYFRPVDAGTANYREIYWRVFVRYPANWQGGGAEKLSRATSFASSSSWAQSMIAHVWSGVDAPFSDYLYIDPASGTDAAGTLRTTTYNDFARLRWLGAAKGTTPLFSAAQRDRWHCVEAHARLNTAGQSNGLFELWVDGTLDASHGGLNWVGNYSAYGINAVFVENYWNKGSPVVQERYIDNFVVSRARVGCGP
jgi:hypothetical protein